METQDLQLPEILNTIPKSYLTITHDSEDQGVIIEYCNPGSQFRGKYLLTISILGIGLAVFLMLSLGFHLNFFFIFGLLILGFFIELFSIKQKTILHITPGRLIIKEVIFWKMRIREFGPGELISVGVWETLNRKPLFGLRLFKPEKKQIYLQSGFKEHAQAKALAEAIMRVYKGM